MNIAIITPFPITYPGGAEKVTLLLCKVLEESGHKVKFFDINLLNKKYKGIFNYKIIGQYKLAYDLGKLFNSEQKSFDLVICNGMFGWNVNFPQAITIQHGNIAAYAIAIKKGMNVLSYYKTRYLDSLFHSINCRNKTVVVVSKRTGLECAKYYKVNKYFVINNTVDIEVFKPRYDKRKFRKRFNLPENSFLGLFVGRPEYRKGIDIIEKISAMLDESNKIVTAIPYPHTNIKNIIPIIALPYKEIPYLYNSCDYFISPSRYEGNSIALLEALASGLPVITTNVGIGYDMAEMGEMMGEFIIDNSDIRIYMKKIKKLFSSDEFYRLELGRRGREYAVKECSLDNFREKYLSLIGNIKN